MAWAEKRGPWFRVRYRDASGVVRTVPDKYRTKAEAANAAEDIDTDVRRGVFIDPQQARTSLADWITDWRKAHLVAPATQAKYDQLLDNHIVPAFGKVSLDQIRRIAVKEWATGLGARYTPSTVHSIVTLLSLVLTAAVEERMIAINPIHGLRLADPRSLQGTTKAIRPARKRPIPTTGQVLAIAERVAVLGGRPAYVMVIAAAFTSMRWGELAGLGRTNCHPAEKYLLIDPDIGALHEVGGKLWLGPPKSPASARRIDLPTFLTDLLTEVMDSHEYEQLFVSPLGEWLRRSNFNRRIWRPACDGDPERGWQPILAGSVFHGLRHHHKTILDETGTPDILKHERMGHEMPGIAGRYSHVTQPMRDRLTKQLQRRWTTTGSTAPGDHNPSSGSPQAPVEQPAPNMLPKTADR